MTNSTHVRSQPNPPTPCCGSQRWHKTERLHLKQHPIAAPCSSNTIFLFEVSWSKHLCTWILGKMKSSWEFQLYRLFLHISALTSTVLEYWWTESIVYKYLHAACSVCTPPTYCRERIVFNAHTTKWPPAVKCKSGARPFFLRRDLRGAFAEFEIIPHRQRRKHVQLVFNSEMLQNGGRIVGCPTLQLQCYSKKYSGLLPRILGRRLLRGMSTHSGTVSRAALRNSAKYDNYMN